MMGGSVEVSDLKIEKSNVLALKKDRMYTVVVDKYFGEKGPSK